MATAFLGPDPGGALFAAFLAANLTAGLAVAAVAVARIAARQAFGPTAAYQLWIVPPAMGFLTLLVVLTPRDSETASVAARAAADLPLGLLPAVWLLGAAAMAAVFAVAQLRFLAEVRAGRAGPAVFGLIAPRIVLPAADGRYSPEERELIRAHEREHVARKDPRAAAMMAAVQALCWFNPFAHLAAHLLRLDQELACDAAVIRRLPDCRSLYARTLLKTHFAARPAPFGCQWKAPGAHPLELRVAMLRRRPGQPGQRAGAGMVLPLSDAIRP